MAALELSKRRDVEYAAGLALALSGGSSRSEALAEDLVKRFPEDTFVNFTYAPVLRALSALGRGKPADGVERLEIARPYELAVNGLNFPDFNLGGLHSAYVRGRRSLPRIGMRKRQPVSEDPRSSRYRGHGSHRRTGALAARESARVVGRQDEGESCLRRLPRTLERRRPRYPNLERRQSRVREAVVIAL
jgi:hypothetical protein